MLRYGPFSLSAFLVLALAGCKDDQPAFDVDALADAGTAGSDGGIGTGDGGVTDGGVTDGGVTDGAGQDGSAGTCDWQIVQEIENPAANGSFGTQLVASESHVAIAGFTADAGAGESVWVFEDDGNGTFALTQQLEPSTGESVQGYGRGLGLNGDRLLVGSTIADRVYVYDNAGADFVETGVIEGPAEDTSFGSGLVALDDRIFIGAPRDGSDSLNSGAIYVVGPSAVGFSAPTRLTGGIEQNQFVGRAIDLGGDVLAVAGVSNARVYIPLDIGVLREAPLEDSTDANSQFGEAVLATESQVFVGAPSSGQGEVLIFEREGDLWNPAGVVTPGAADGAMLFGNALAGNDQLLVVGSSSLSADAGSGQVFFFEPSAAGVWQQVAVLNAPASPAGSLFGASVAVSGDRVLISDRARETSGVGTGFVYVAACQ